MCYVRRTKGNKNRRKARKRSLKKGKNFSETPTGDRGSSGRTFAAEACESIELKLHGQQADNSVLNWCSGTTSVERT